MSSRLFRHTASRKFHIAKVALATLTITAIFLGNVTAVFAQTTTDPFKPFVELFGSNSVGDPIEGGTVGAKNGTETGLFYGGVLDSERVSGGVQRFFVGATLILPGVTDSPDPDNIDKIDKIWNLVSHDGGDDGYASYPEQTVVMRVYTINTDGSKSNFHIDSLIYRPHLSAPETATYPSGLGVPPTTTTFNGTAGSFANALFKKNEIGNNSDKYFINQRAYLPYSGGVITPYKTKLGADLWYCGGEDGAIAYDNRASIPDMYKDQVAFFNTKTGYDKDYCGGTAYWKIGRSITFAMPDSINDHSGQITAEEIQNNATKQTTVQSPLPECGWTTIAGCFARLVYYIVFKPIAWVAGLFGKLFDFFIGYSVSDESYRFGFAVRGWQLVRDISNIFFILILVWTGFAAVFGISKFSMKQLVPALIINAIIINFSLFATRTVIDFSNIFARVFYSRIYVCNGPCVDDDHNGTYDNLKRGLGGYWPLSEKIVSSFNPQTILQPSIIQTSKVENPGVDQNPVNCTEGTVDSTISGDCLKVNGPRTGGFDTSSSEYAGYFIIVSLIGAAIMFAILKMFWGVAFMFLGRVIGLYVCMIFAPFAFLSRKIPFLEKIDELSWTKWSGNLTNYALLAPIFIFYLYIVYSFLSTKFLADFGLQQAGGSFFESVLYITIPMLIIYFLIDYGKKLAKKYAGEAGNMIQDLVQKKIVGGAAVATVAGIATGGIAAVGRGTLGRVGANLANSQTLRNWSGSDNWFARQIGNAGVRLGERGANATFDARNTGALKQIGITGKENTAVTKSLRLATDNTKGGVVGSIDRKEKRAYKRMETYQLTGDVKAIQDTKVTEWDNKNIKTDLDAWKLANPTLARDDFSLNQKKRELVKAKSIPGNERPKSADEINLERNTAYGKRQKSSAKYQEVIGRILGGPGAVTGGTGAIVGNNLSAGLGALSSTIGGELATGAIANRRVGSNVGKLGDFENLIKTLEADIAPLQNWWLTGTPPPPPIMPAGTTGPITKIKLAELNSLKAKLKATEGKRDSLNERLTK